MLNEGGALSCIRGEAREKSAAPRKAIWLISFGDLLTLLWCMMLSLICYGHFRPAPRGQSPEARQALTSTDTGAHGERELGIALAHSKGRVKAPSAGEIGARPAAVLFGERDFVEQGALSGDADMRLYGFLAGNKVVGTMTIETCAKGQDGTAWFASIDRALLLRAKMLSGGIGASELRVRPLGPHCETLAHSGGSDTQALVSFTTGA